MVRLFSVVLALLVLTACSDELFGFEEEGEPVLARELAAPSDRTVIEAAIRGRYFDPDAVTFRNLRFFDLGNYGGEGLQVAVCGESNGKNRYGAYTGYEHFYSRYNRDTGEIMFSANYDDSDKLDRAFLGTSCDAFKAGEPIRLRY